MTLDVGMYVRTPKGLLGKVIGISKVTGRNQPCYLVAWSETKAYYVAQVSKFKASYKIGELLEEGDFIDHWQITAIRGTTIITSDGWFVDIEDVEDLVTTITTKEQFESVAYKVPNETK